MRIQELQIDRFGVWRGLNLPLTTSNATVFYGPNEAGKSTLRRFIRGMLYGFQPQDEKTPGPQPTKVSCRGILRLEHEGREYEIMRESQAGTRGRLSVEGDTDPARSQVLLSRILGNAGEGLFENVFAIGLNELQELATLDGADVARHIYGLSLGLDGEKILTTQLTIDHDRKRLFSDDRMTGVIADLAKQLDGVDSQIGKTVDVSQKYVDLLAQREKLEAEVGKTKRRQVDVQQNLRGWQFFERVWGPWNKERTLRAEYNAMPSLVGVSEQALDELDKLDREIDSQDTRRRKLIEEARRLYEQAEALQLEPQFEEHVCTIRKLVEQQDQVRTMERTLPEKRARLEALRKECEERTPGSVSGLMNNPVDRMELGSSMTHLLLDRSRRYRGTVTSRGRLLKRYKKATSNLAKKQAAFEDELRQFGGLTIAQAKTNASRRLDELENLMRLRSRQAALADAHAAASEYLNTATRRRELPPFFYLCLWFFGVAGVILFLAGLYGSIFGLLREGVGPNVWLIGLCYAFLGACSAGVTWTMREYFEPQQMDFGGLKQRHRDLEAELNQVNRSMEKILQSESKRPGVSLDLAERSDPNAEITETDVMAAIRRRLVDLDMLGNREAELDETRRKLSLWRQAIQHRQKEVSTARRDWCDLLRKLGLSETIKISEAFQSWEKIAESRSVFSDWKQAQKEHDRDRQQVDAFRKTVEDLSKELNPGKPVGDMYLLVSEWDRRLRNLEERRRERSALKLASKQKRRDAEQFDGPITDLRGRREALLVRCNCTNRDELVAKIKLLKRAAELATLLSMAKGELETVARAEPELALVEDDLLAYDPGRNKRSIEAATDEITQLDRSLQQTYEVLGRVKAELRDLENDRRASSLRYDRAQIQADLHSAIAQLVTGDAAARSLERLRKKLESDGQTGTLKLASNYLSQLTCGKYRRIWAPIGERHLVVDDEQGQSLRVEHLSSGTREQVFLAARLAMSREFADRGAGLPLVLDDVTVNFDQVRTEAAVKTLLDIADRGQQVLLFTCHQHVANLFQQQGIEPVWLPANSASEFRYAS